MINSGKPTYFPYIDGLRAIAVLSVIIYHLDATWLPGGFSGVDIFFVISGFVVSASVGELRTTNLWQFFAYFYARRLQRIAPALIVCLLATGLASALFIPGAWLSDTNQRTGLFAFFGLSNFILSQTGNDYFSPKVEFNPYTHTWSLGVEEQFYLIFPLLFFAWVFSSNGRRLSIALFIGGFVASLLFASHLGQTNGTLAFYMLSSRFWELGTGVLLYQILTLFGHTPDSKVRPMTHLSTVGAWVSVGFVGTGFLFTRPETFPFPGAIATVLGTAGILAFLYGRQHTSLLLHVLTNRITVFIGKISYSLYLWHWPVFVLFRWTAGLESIACRISAFSITFALATLSYFFIENKVRYSSILRKAPRAVVVVSGLLLIGTTSWFSSFISENQPRLSLSTVTKHAADWYPYGVETSPDYPGCTVQTKAEDVQGGLLWIYSRSQCGGQPSYPERMFVIGDSHAMAYSGMLKQMVLQTGMEVFAYNNGGCPFMSFQPWRENENTLCNHYAEAAVADISGKAKPGDILFLPSLRLPRFGDQWSFLNEVAAKDMMFGPRATSGRQSAESQAIPILRKLTSKGIRIVFEAPKPLFRAPPFRCSDWFNKSNPVCHKGAFIMRDEIEMYRKPVLDSYQRIANVVPGVRVWDPLPILCPGSVCQTKNESRPLFFDGDHVSGYGNTILFPHFRDFIIGTVSVKEAIATD